MSNQFWPWFLRLVCSSQRITLPNVGTFSVVFSEQKTFNMIWTQSILAANQDDGQYSVRAPDLQEQTIARKAYIRFRPSGNLKTSIKEFIRNCPIETQRCYTGDRDPVKSVSRWGKIVARNNDITNLSLHRRLIWSFHRENDVPLEESARIVSTSLQSMGNSIASRGFARLMSDMRIQIVRGKKNVLRPSNNPNRWRARFTVPQEYIIQMISDQNIQ